MWEEEVEVEEEAIIGSPAPLISWNSLIICN
jgi:hypothetical protein